MSHRQPRIPIGGGSDEIRRTDNLQELTTRGLRLLNSNGTAPGLGGIPYISDTIGYVALSAATLTGGGSLVVPGTLTATGNITLTSPPPQSIGGNQVLSYDANNGKIELQTEGASSMVLSVLPASGNIVIDPPAGVGNVTVDLSDNITVTGLITAADLSSGTLYVSGNAEIGVMSVPASTGPVVITSSHQYGTLQLQTIPTDLSENAIFIKRPGQTGNNGWLVGTSTNMTTDASGFAIRHVVSGGVTPQGISMLSTGEVGIGTSAPATILDIYEDLSYAEISTNTTPPLNAQVNIGSGSHRLKLGSYYTFNAGEAAVIKSTNVSNNVEANLLLNPAGGNVGIGTTTPAGNLHIKAAVPSGDVEVPAILILQSAYQFDEARGYTEIRAISDATLGAGAAMSFYTRQDAGGNFDPADLVYERMRISNVGNVGIGTTAPTATLDVSGSVHLSGLPLTTNTNVLGIDGSGNVSVQPAPASSIVSMAYNLIPNPDATVGNSIRVVPLITAPGVTLVSLGINPVNYRYIEVSMGFSAITDINANYYTFYALGNDGSIGANAMGDSTYYADTGARSYYARFIMDKTLGHFTNSTTSINMIKDDSFAPFPNGFILAYNVLFLTMMVRASN
jgi:hypothetical protein